MVKDTGERRTYPNILTREAVRGMEWEAWSEGNPPEHLVEIPFTRMIAGPMSYTPGIFDVTWDPGGPGRPPWRTLEHTRVHSTRAAQLAHLSRVPERPADDGRHPGALRGPAGARVPRAGAHHVGRHQGAQRRRSATTSPWPEGAAGLVRRQHDRRAGTRRSRSRCGSSSAASSTSRTSTATRRPPTSRPTRTRSRSRGSSSTAATPWSRR